MNDVVEVFEPAPVVDHTVADGSLTDGRNARRFRNRQSVVDAYIDLASAGNHAPTLEELAGHSGVSFRSVYRYFSGTDELLAAVAERGIEMAIPLIELENEGFGNFDERLAAFIETRIALHTATSGLSAIARGRHGSEPSVASAFFKLRRMNLEIIDRHFDTELSGLSHEARQNTVSAIYFGFTFESFRMLNEMYPGDADRIRHVLSMQIRAHLAPHAS